MYDSQVPTGSGFWHWVLADIPAWVTELPEDAGAPESRVLPSGAFQLGADAGARQYVGGAPPAGSGVHEYHLTVTALDAETTGLEHSAGAAFLGFATGGNTLARVTLVCPTPAPAA